MHKKLRERRLQQKIRLDKEQCEKEKAQLRNELAHAQTVAENAIQRAGQYFKRCQALEQRVCELEKTR